MYSSFVELDISASLRGYYILSWYEKSNSEGAFTFSCCVAFRHVHIFEQNLHVAAWRLLLSCEHISICHSNCRLREKYWYSLV